MDRLSFNLESEEVKYLYHADPTLGNIIKAIGTVDIPLSKDYYSSIVKQIIGQQFSLKAAATIKERLENIWPNLQAELLEKITDEQIRCVGVSRPKITYIRELTHKHLSGEVDLSKIDMLGDEDVIKVLTSVKGIGTWTAEMFLIFSLGRLNILSYNDISIRNAIRLLYQMEKDDPLDLDHFYHKWKPYNSIASLYLWEAIDLELFKKSKNDV